ncbi:hypothetical protein GN956_G7846 [Arapaima gigas]
MSLSLLLTWQKPAGGGRFTRRHDGQKLPSKCFLKELMVLLRRHRIQPGLLGQWGPLLPQRTTALGQTVPGVQVSSGTKVG